MNQRHTRRTVFHLHQENPGRRAIRTFPFAAPCRAGGRNRPPRLLFVIVITLAAALLSTQSSPADEGLLRGPGKTVRTRAIVAGPTDGTQGILEEIAAAPVLFYQHYLSHLWGQSCAYYPSCSNYALLAIRKHGAVVGTMITFDRLQHEANEGRTSPLILAGGQIKVYDPLENNDYWWYMKPGSEPIAPADKERKTKP
ncbi:MAG: membrane protein insertion efficiency factor YidD [Syntrophales bacterium]|nr:membrane protein insertion efficiency factor YidD [Syntrophales bacterium]